MGPRSCWGLKQEPKAPSLSQLWSPNLTADVPRPSDSMTGLYRKKTWTHKDELCNWCLSGGSLLAWWLMVRSMEALFVHAEVEETLPLFKSQVLLNTVHRTALALCTGREKRASARESPTCGNSPLERSPSQFQHFCQGAISNLYLFN